MESTLESIQVGLVQRAVAFGMAVVASSTLFTSAILVLTASANSPAATRVAQAAVQTVVGV